MVLGAAYFVLKQLDLLVWGIGDVSLKKGLGHSTCPVVVVTVS